MTREMEELYLLPVFTKQTEGLFLTEILENERGNPTKKLRHCFTTAFRSAEPSSSWLTHSHREDIS